MIGYSHTRHNREFWIAQSVGWGLVSATNFVLQYAAGVTWQTTLVNSLMILLPGVLVTTLYRQLVYRWPWARWSLRRQFGVVFLAVLVQTLLIVTPVAIFSAMMGEAVTSVRFISNSFIFFIVLMAWNAIYHGVQYFRRYSRAEVERLRLATEVKDAQLAALRAQLNPHFTFNTLNNIRALIDVDPGRCREVLDDFADLLRYALSEPDTKTVPLQRELEVVRQYLRILTVQYEERLRYSIAVPEQYHAVAVPPMSLQLLVENAVKHGVARQPGGGDVTVTGERVDDQLHLYVYNTGHLVPAPTTVLPLDDRLGVGIPNLQRRLRLLYGTQADFRIRQVDERIEALITLPLAHELSGR